MHVAAIEWSNLTAKASINFAFVVVLGGAAGVLWAKARHRRELDLAALARFYDVYGTWFATWKGWSALLERKLPERGKRLKQAAEAEGQFESERGKLLKQAAEAEGQFESERGKLLKQAAEAEGQFESERGKLLKQAAEAEGQFEALLVKIAIERRLSTAETGRLGRFREGYQQLRECIEKGVELPFRVQFLPEERSAYVAFKDLSVEFAALLQGRSWTSALAALVRGEAIGRPPLPRGQEALIKVTSWRVSHPSQKNFWWRDPGAKSVDEAVETWKHDLPYRHPSGK